MSQSRHCGECVVCTKVRKCGVVVVKRDWIGEDVDLYLRSAANRHPSRLRIFGACKQGRGIVMKSFGTSLHTLIRRREPLALVQVATALCRAFAITVTIGESWFLRSSTTFHCVRVDTSSNRVKLVFPFGPAADDSKRPQLDPHHVEPMRLMAPDIVKERSYGEKCCVWLFGIMCRQMALHELVPCPEMEAIRLVTGLYYGHIELGGRDTMERLQHAPVVFRHVVAQCLQKQRHNRPTFAKLLTWLESRQTLCTVAIALQSLDLPALLTLMIGDEFIDAAIVEFLPIHVRYVR